MNPMQTHGAVSWIEHSGPDAAKAKAFYETVLGWAINSVEMQAGAYDTITLGETPIGGISPMAGDGSWKIYITVDDVDARIAKVVENGGTLEGEAMTVPGVGRMATVVDPFGAHLCLIDSSKA